MFNPSAPGGVRPTKPTKAFYGPIIPIEEEVWTKHPTLDIRVSTHNRVSFGDSDHCLTIPRQEYAYVYIDKTIGSKFLHRLVCEAFHGLAPK